MENILFILVAWALLELGLSAYDAYDTTRTVLSSEASPQEKEVAVGLFALGLVKVKDNDVFLWRKG